MTKNTLTTLSLGAGVQSSVLLLLSCHGILPKPDVALFADTGWEPSSVYHHLWWLAEQATSAGIPVLIHGKGNIKNDALRSIAQRARWASMPLFTRAPNGKIGMIRRQCTKEYKLETLLRATRAWMGLAKGQRVPADVHVSQWIGISINEKQRMRLSPHRWLTNEYPLIGWPTQYLARPWTRSDCQLWFASHYSGRILPRSACIGCPFHSDTEWDTMRKTRPDEWRDACDFDRAIRQREGTRGGVFLHRSGIPLEDVDLSLPHAGQLSFGNECLGMCGV